MLNKKLDTSRMLRVIFTDTERLELGKQLAEAHNELLRVKSDFDRVKADFKARQTDEEATISTISTNISSGYHMVETKCRWSMDLPLKGMKTLFRLDLNETVETCEMTEADRQVEIDLYVEPTPPPP
jgi:hypothetical protein